MERKIEEMQTFSINTQKNIKNAEYSDRVWKTLQTLWSYIVNKCSSNTAQAKEILMEAYNKMLLHRDDTYTDLTPYAKQTVNGMLKERIKIGNHVSCDPQAIRSDEDYKGRGKPTDSFDMEYQSYMQEDSQADLYTDTNIVVEELETLYLRDNNILTFLKSLTYTDKTMSEAKKLTQKQTKLVDAEVMEDLKKLLLTTNEGVFGQALCIFLQRLAKYLPKDKGTVKAVKAQKIKDKELNSMYYKGDSIKIKDKKYRIDSKGTGMTYKRDIDSCAFDVITELNTLVYKVDIAPLLYWLEEQIYVDEGVTNKVLSRLYNKCGYKTPGGEIYVDIDKDHFMDMVKIELIYSLGKINACPIVGVAVDSIYI